MVMSLIDRVNYSEMLLLIVVSVYIAPDNVKARWVCRVDNMDNTFYNKYSILVYVCNNLILR